MSKVDEQVLVDGGRVLQMRDRLVSLGLEMASTTRAPFAEARKISQLVDSPEFIAAERAAGRLQTGGAR